MDNKNGEKKAVTLTEEQATRAAETLINAWLRDDDNISYSNKTPNSSKNTK